MSDKLFAPVMAPAYEMATPALLATLRVIVGIFLVMHGLPKASDPLAAVGMVSGLGFAPAEFWSILLSYSEFFSGILITVGLLTGPAAIVASIILLVTAYAHGIAWGEGVSGSEKSLIWAAAVLVFVGYGGGKFSIDRLLPKHF